MKTHSLLLINNYIYSCWRAGNVGSRSVNIQNISSNSTKIVINQSTSKTLDNFTFSLSGDNEDIVTISSNTSTNCGISFINIG